MSDSAAKKRTVDGKLKPKPRKPIVFELPDLQVDVRLKVFNQDFHVHSTLLKLYSAYFRKFLDSPDKTPASSSAKFRYEYVSVVDDDGEWGLEVAKTSTASNAIKLKDGRTKVSEKKAFHRLLCAIYGRPHEFRLFKEFKDTLRLADFYCALPKLSSSLDNTVLRTQGIHFKNASKQMLLAAQKLRHPTLFRETFICYISNTIDVDEDPVHGIEDKDLQILILREQNRIQKLQTEVDFLIHIMGPSDRIAVFGGSEVGWEPDVGRLSDNWYGEGTRKKAWWYRQIYNRVQQVTEIDEEAWEPLALLLEINLTFNPKFRKNEDDEYGFFCAEVADEDLPWNTNAIDW